MWAGWLGPRSLGEFGQVGAPPAVIVGGRLGDGGVKARWWRGQGRGPRSPDRVVELKELSGHQPAAPGVRDDVVRAEHQGVPSGSESAQAKLE